VRVISLSPTQSEIMNALRTGFLQQVLPQGSAILTGSASGTTLTATKVSTGSIGEGDMLFFKGSLPGTQVVAQLSGPAGKAGTYEISPAQTSGILPMCTGVPVIQGQGNRVAPPPAENYVIFTPMFKPRLATNIDDNEDCYFQASIAGTAMTVSDVAYGAIRKGAAVFGVGVASFTYVTDGPDDGGPGAYTVSVPQTVSIQGMAAGVHIMTQETAQHVQIDFYGPLAADYAQMVSTLFRDVAGVELFAATGLPISPLHADDPRQGPFVDGEQQYENRWTVDAVLQADQAVTVPQDYAGALAVDLISVDAAYTP
jgi:hypothetical protein